ncbi:class I lanthipeptide [Aquimarina sp. D1M17]|uniref:class I lanthipeptide n=1 Tax=Aquimarina acroporae TaxID=2937283 RepID=UPI0020C06A4E|nr:class I lanthipeptide [Aquimarina acroporae]MCK8523552.1 class I lanthipeptide [Aquimarina acroporae]
MKRKKLTKISLHKSTITKLNDLEKAKVKAGSQETAVLCELEWTSSILSMNPDCQNGTSITC